MGGWAVAQSPILITTITLSHLRRKGMNLCFPIASKPARPCHSGGRNPQSGELGLSVKK
jgi:hypothetical protein